MPPGMDTAYKYNLEGLIRLTIYTMMKKLLLKRITNKHVYNLALVFLLLLPVAVILEANGQDELLIIEGTGKPQITLDEIKAEINHIENSEIIDVETKKSVLDIYQQAITQLKVAANWKAKTNALTVVIDTAPSKMESIKEELAAPFVETSPDIQSDYTLPQLEALLAQAKTAFITKQNELTRLESEPQHRSSRQIAIPDLITEANKRLEEIEAQIAGLKFVEEASELKKARTYLFEIKKETVFQEINNYEKEIQSYNVTSELILLQRELAARHFTQTEKLASALENAINERRRVKAEHDEQKSKEALRAAINSAPFLHDLIEENAALAKKRTGVNGLIVKIENTSREIETFGQKLQQIKDDFDITAKKVEAAGLTNAIGLVLRKKREELPDISGLIKRIKRRKTEIVNAQLELIDLEELRSHLSDIEPMLKDALDTFYIGGINFKPEEIENEIRVVLENRKEYLEALINDTNSLFSKLINLDTIQRKLLLITEEFRDYINEHILWVQSAPPFRFSDFSRMKDGVSWLVNKENWAGLIERLWKDINRNPISFIIFLNFIIALFVFQPILRRKIKKINSLVTQNRYALYRYTYNVLIFTVIKIAMLPFITGFVAWRLSVSLDGLEFDWSISAGLYTFSLFYFALKFIEETHRSNGLAESHFRWDLNYSKIVRNHLKWFKFIALPLSFLISVFEFQSNDLWLNSIGRISFIALLLTIASFIILLLRSEGKITQDVEQKERSKWFFRFRYLWYSISALIPFILVALSVFGYFYTARRLELRFYACFGLVFIYFIIKANFLRWFSISQAKLGIKEFREKQVSHPSDDKTVTGAPLSEEKSETLNDLKLDLKNINIKTRQLLRALLGLFLVVAIWFIWSGVFPAFSVLKKIELWSSIKKINETIVSPNGSAAVQVLENNVPVTLADLLFAIIIIVFTFIIAKNMPKFLEFIILQRLSLEKGIQFATTTILRYFITIIGILIACGYVGLSWGKVQWLVAAISVGLGFGIQEIFANFVSGLIILFERPVRLGDIVTVGDISGEITRIQIRATTICDWDKKEVIVPNKEFVTGKMTNWTLSNRILRLIIPVGIAYGSDTELVKKILFKTAREHPMIVNDPEPLALFIKFDDSSLNFELRVFIGDFTHGDMLKIRDELMTSINNAFKDAGIVIAFPQRDINIKTMQDNLFNN